jgi:heme oxygenase (biliverdin-IX-beta and delta-forming)
MFLARLRTATGLHHASLESSPLLAALMTPDLDRAVYTAILRKFYGFMRPLEARAYRPEIWEGWGLEMAKRRKVALLEQDLAYLGSSSGLDAIPFCEDLPCTDHLAQCIGVIYVCEGSTLGGRVISRKLEQSLGINPGRGGLFFSGYGSRTKLLWNDLCEKIESHAREHVYEQPAIEEAAVETFRKLKRWFDVRGGASAS